MEDRLAVGRSQFEKVWIIILMKTLQSNEFGLKKTSKVLRNENKIIPPSIIISVTRLLFGGRVCPVLCVTVGRCAAAVLRPLLAVCSNPLLALFHGAAVRSALSLPLADKSRVLLSYATFRHAQHPQTHDGGRLLGKLLRLLPENTNEFVQLKL